MTTTEEFDPREYEDHRTELTAEELALTEAKIAKINDRAAKRGWTGRLTVEAEAREITEENAAGVEVTRLVYLTRITGQAPKYDGWTFLAVLDWHSAGGELITRVAPGVDAGIIDRTNLRPGACDQCGTTRDRKDIYLVRNESGDTKQVGTTCIKDFLGWNAQPVWISEEDHQDDFVFTGTGRWVDYDTSTVLLVAWALIKEYGFAPSNFYATSTKSRTLAVLDPRTKEERALAASILPHLAEGKAQVELIKAYILGDDFSGGEYAVNLKVALRATHVTSRLFGLVVSAPQAWAKAVERDLTRKAQRAEIVNEHVGQVGDKLTVTVTVKSIRYFENGFGTSTLYTMVSDTGHLFKWFASRSVLGEEVTDKVYVITGTVKKLDVYQDAKSTVLTRCKVA